uniref:Integrase catalytic domain-containing protein n=2 Tax=Nicotiana TaxID=4085 RepID=A0A1S4CVE1_TOBAC|nr:PREDICTED: uncharacterized protein LOC104233660 [Nicotiana sylvestris]XP_016504969.1 PREDICTED: uncharacterized protein LOC107822895 [Nicotiana tabacum]
MPYHPAGNGQAESSNKTILNILKKKFEDAKGLWPELLPEVLWAYHTTPKTNTGEIQYSLAYGTDAVIRVEVGEPSLRYSNESGSSNDESRLQNLDEVEERSDMAHIRMVAQKQQGSNQTEGLATRASEWSMNGLGVDIHLDLKVSVITGRG